ncbi:MAG: response regulator [Chitinophagaceae bacterium]
MEQRKKTLVIFDDDEDILSICSYIMKARGWTVHTFVDCNNVVERLLPLNPDVVLMDNWIPDEGGIVATQAIRNSTMFKDLPVIYFSANSDIKSLAEQAGADSFIAKPFNLDTLEKQIAQSAKLPGAQ